ncbi:MAG: NAD(P)-dependent glycerol-3-phosphate dehydrogenase [Rhodospirillales bacterium]|nr:NAD(P)-dependent glycerol-3-phosphate dehydrogenase [Rhodospirillales bacterium]
MKKVGVIGAGAWGTALAQAVRQAGKEVVLQSHESEVADAINHNHENTIYLPGIELDPGIKATPDLAEGADVDAVLLVAPAQHLRTVCEGLKPHLKKSAPVVICAKGIENDTCLLMSEVVREVLPEAPIAVLSGPSFAKEVAAGLPTAVTLAMESQALVEELTDVLASTYFRIYRSTDIVGTEIGGAVKNVLAIACGIAEGRQLGDNTRATLITRGLAEMARLGIAKGARMETLMGLSGMGDLTLTCSAMQSRNFSLGFALGEGRTLEEILSERQAVTEGVFSASSVTDLAKRLDVEMPICTAVDGIINHFADIEATIKGLLSRPFKDEFS